MSLYVLCFRAVSFLTINNNIVSPEPSAELLMNISRSRRLIVVLSYAYLEQDWCCNNFRSDSQRCIQCRNNTLQTVYILYKTDYSIITIINHLRAVLLPCTAVFTVYNNVLRVFSDRAFCTCWSYVRVPSSSC